MKIAAREHVDATAGVQDEVAISFEANAVAFYAQISGLAKDKIGYPIRELSTNAWDASRGRFEVFLPTNLNPTFRVRDYGPGMDHDQMTSVYARLYASTKRGTNDEVGGWGLGSKSPFAYLIGDGGSGSYTVTSYHEGVMRTYVLSLSADGRPMMRRLAEMPTDAESGLEVSFAVRRSDIETFTYRARKILWSFEPRPRVFPEMGWQEPEIRASGETWKLYRDYTVPFEGPHVRMGPVMYPFDIGEVAGSRLLTASDTVLFDAPIGSLSVTLSREALAYDERTRQTLTALVSAYENAVVAQMQEKVSAAETYIHACKVFFEETSHFGASRQSYLRERVLWREMRLAQTLSTPNAKAMLVRGSWNYEKFERETIMVQNVPDEHEIVIEHNPNYSFNRMEVAGLAGKNLVWIRVKREDLDGVLDALGHPEYKVLDTFKPDKTKMDQVRRSKTVRRRRILIARATYGASQSTEEIDLAEGGYFVQRYAPSGYGRRYNSGYQISEDGPVLADSNFNDVVRAAISLGVIPDGTEFLMRTPKDTLSEDWVWPKQVLVDGLRQHVDVAQFTGLHQKSIYNIPSDIREMGHRWNFSNAPEDLRALHAEAQTLYRSLRENNRESTASDRAVAALRLLGETIEIPEITCPIATLESRYEALQQKYPLFSMIVSDHRYSGGQEKLDHYFSLLECQNDSADRN